MASDDSEPPPNPGAIYNTVIVGGGDSGKSLDGLVGVLPPPSSGTPLFQDPRHNRLRDVLEQERLLLLSSYRDDAAYAAAYCLAGDDHFALQAKTAFYPNRGRDKDRTDLDVFVICDEQFLGERPQILVIAVDGNCALLDSALRGMSSMALAMICEKLKQRQSYVIFVVKEDLVLDRLKETRVSCFSVSYLRYLLDATGRGEEFERRILAAVRVAAASIQMLKLYQLVADVLKAGVETFEQFLRELERTHELPAERQGVARQVTPENVFPEESPIHRAAVFVATYFPEIGQRDFDRLVTTLLGDQVTLVEHSRQVVAPDGTVSTLRVQVEERWIERWIRGADRVFRESHLRHVASTDGARLVDFTEPYLRLEMRAYFESEHAFYLRQQCQILQERGVLFALDVSATAVEALVRLFVERAVVDPVGFGSYWLLDLVQGLRIQVSGDPPGQSKEEVLAWILEQVTLEQQLRAHFHSRLALLVREMLDREPLRRMVWEFFEFLIAARQHDALLGVVLDLARRLRFAPHFEPLVWMKRLLDQGSAFVRDKTAARLATLARDSGPRIYEFLTTIRGWLPEANRTPERFSTSNRVALQFPFAYCVAVARVLPQDRYGQWPSSHPLFYALPTDPNEARREIGTLMGWVLDVRGAAMDEGDATESPDTSAAKHMADVADLVEHWAAVLEGVLSGGHAEGRALFRVIVEEIDQRLDETKRSALLQSWRRRQDDYVRQVTSLPFEQRTPLIARRAKIEQLRRRLFR